MITLQIDIKKNLPVVAHAVEQVPQLYSPAASPIAPQWYSAIAELYSLRELGRRI